MADDFNDKVDQRKLKKKNELRKKLLSVLTKESLGEVAGIMFPEKYTREELTKWTLENWSDFTDGEIATEFESLLKQARSEE